MVHGAGVCFQRSHTRECNKQSGLARARPAARLALCWCLCVCACVCVCVCACLCVVLVTFVVSAYACAGRCTAWHDCNTKATHSFNCSPKQALLQSKTSHFCFLAGFFLTAVAFFNELVCLISLALESIKAAEQLQSNIEQCWTTSAKEQKETALGRY